MLIGVPKEIKNHEYRVGLTPESVRELVASGHEVWVESGAGLGIGAADEDYKAAGAAIQRPPRRRSASVSLRRYRHSRSLATTSGTLTPLRAIRCSASLTMPRFAPSWASYRRCWSWQPPHRSRV